MTTHFNSKLDLTFERIVDVPPHLIWRAWTGPELIRQWFCPLPWKMNAPCGDESAEFMFTARWK